MTQDALKALTDGEISQVIAWGQAEIAARVEQRKQDAIAKIRELAAAVGVSIAIEGTRGRPRRKPTAKPEHVPARRPAVPTPAASGTAQVSRGSSARS